MCFFKLASRLESNRRLGYKDFFNSHVYSKTNVLDQAETQSIAQIKTMAQIMVLEGGLYGSSVKYVDSLNNNNDDDDDNNNNNNNNNNIDNDDDDDDNNNNSNKTVVRTHWRNVLDRRMNFITTMHTGNGTVKPV